MVRGVVLLLYFAHSLVMFVRSLVVVLWPGFDALVGTGVPACSGVHWSG